MNKKRLIIFICVLFMLLLAAFSIFGIKKLDKETYYYSVADSSNYYTVKFDLNGASFIDTKILRCKIEGNGCYVTLPNAKRDNGIVLGYSDNKSDTLAKYLPGTDVFLSDNVTLYVISYQDNTLTIPDNDVDYLEKNNLSCRAYNKEKSCKVVLPLYNREGYENKGYSTSRESLTGFVYANDEYSLSHDTVMYPIYSTSSRHRSINVAKTLTYNNSFIEIEKGCEESVYKSLLEYLDGIKYNTSFLLLGNKISFLTDDTFDEVWGTRYVGMNYGPKSLRSVDIRCSTRVYNDYYATMVHEMAHSWDFYYARMLNDNISSQGDVINLYNKYKEQNTGLFREYSFSNLYEFVADMMRYYYFKYYVPRNPFNSLSYPNDVKNVLEKYICISKNNYNDTLCK